MVDIWHTRIERLLKKPFEPQKTTAENISHLPPEMQQDRDLRAFVWKYSLFIATPFRDRQSLEEDLKRLWQVLEQRYNPTPDYLRRKPQPNEES